MKRRESRERALVALYQMDLLGIDPIEALTQRCQEDEVNVNELSESIVNIVKEKLESIDEDIKKYSTEWDVNRLSYIDRNILRVAICEIKYIDAIPFKASINEAVEMAKTYSSDDAYKFINGILAQIVKENEEVEKNEIES